MKYFIFILLLTVFPASAQPPIVSSWWDESDWDSWERSAELRDEFRKNKKRKELVQRYVKGKLRLGYIHPNGGGFVGIHVRVGNNVYIGRDATVIGVGRIGDNVRILDTSQVSGRSFWIGDNVEIFRNARVGSYTTIRDNARVTGNAPVSTIPQPVNEEVASEIPEPSKEKVDNFLNTVGTRSGIDANNNCQPLSE